jgi:hypothetical protein
MDAFFHEDIHQYKLLPPKGVKRRLHTQPDDVRFAKRRETLNSPNDDFVMMDDE